MPKIVSGVVTLDGKGLKGVRVTDGVGFVTTDADGRYSISIKPDPLVPYLPSRTIGVCWPTGTWPVKDDRTGRWGWWARLKDVRGPASVHFALVSRKQELPVCLSFGTDPHDNFTRPHNFIWRDETAGARDHVTFAVCGGDLGYLGFGNADEAYTSIQKFTHEFPVLMLHCIGNHDVVGIHGKWWSVPHELAGNGAFMKYLGPIRWSFDAAGIHFVGMDWGLIDEKGHMQCGLAESAIDWLEKDLKALPQGTPVYFLNHQAWSPHPRFYEILAKYGVRLCLGGHSHRNMLLNTAPPKKGEIEFWTKMSLYTLVYVDEDGFEFVDRCIYRGGRNGWDGHWHHHRRACALYNDPEEQKRQRSEHVGFKDVTLDCRTRSIPPAKGATYDLRIGARAAGQNPARRWGLRIVREDGTVCEFVYDRANHMLNLMGLDTYFNPKLPPGQSNKAAEATDPTEQQWVEMRIFVMPDRVRVLVNSRLHYQKFVKPGAAKKIEFFAEEGAAEFGRVDIWRRTWKDYQPRPAANTG